MKPKPFDALNHFTFPVGTRLSWRKIWIECSPEPLLWPGATQDSLVQFAGAALTGARVCRYTRPVARGTPAPRAATPAQGGCHEAPAFWPDAACVAGIGTGGCAADPVRRVGPPEAAEGPVPRRSHRGRGAMVFGRKQEASARETGPLERHNPPLPHEDGRVRQVTDVAFDAAGNAYISDGYINSRVAKVDRNGRWLKSW